jgi:hypothetical protein
MFEPCLAGTDKANECLYQNKRRCIGKAHAISAWHDSMRLRLRKVRICWPTVHQPGTPTRVDEERRSLHIG